jgi:hypothetical protein
VAEAADARVAAPIPRLVAPWPGRGAPTNSAHRLTVEATVVL